MNHAIAATWGVLLSAGAALGQAGWTLTPVFAPGQRGITPRTPSCVVGASAYFARNDFALAGVRFDVNGTSGGWSGSTVLPSLRTGSNPGTVVGSSVVGIIGGQLNFPVPIWTVDPSNPIDVWEAVWSTTDFTPRTVAVTTFTRRFDVYPLRSSPSTQSRMPVAEGRAEIAVLEPCYPDCDTSTGWGELDVFDFLCFQNRFDQGAPYACDCDTTTGTGVCDLFDFLCYQNAYDAGCP